jgi:hypothetical protein
VTPRSAATGWMSDTKPTRAAVTKNTTAHSDPNDWRRDTPAGSTWGPS